MKHLNEYINEEHNLNNDLLFEGFWDKLGSMFGFSTKKVAIAMKDWSDDLKKGFTTGQYLAAKSKDKDIKKAAEEQAKATEEGKDKLLQKVKDECTRLSKNIKDISLPEYCLKQYQLLRDLSKELNDKDGQTMADNFKKIIDKKWPDDLEKTEKNLEKITLKIEKAGVAEGPKSDKSSEETNSEPNKAAQEEGKNAATDAIKDNKEIFQSLAKVCNINGEKLRDYVGKYILSQDETGKFKKKEDIAKITDDEVLGTCIIVCGALITNNQNYFARIAKTIGLKDKNKMQEYIKN